MSRLASARGTMGLYTAAAAARRLVEPVLTVVFPSGCAACGRLLAQPSPERLAGLARAIQAGAPLEHLARAAASHDGP